MNTTNLSEWSGKPTTDQWRCENTNKIFCISRYEMEYLKREKKKKENGEHITRSNSQGEIVLSFDNPIVPKTKNQMKDPNKYICIICLNKTGKKCAIEKHLHVKNLQEEAAKEAKRKKIEKLANTKQRKKSVKKSLSTKKKYVKAKTVVANVVETESFSKPATGKLSIPLVYPLLQKRKGWKEKSANDWTTITNKKCIPVVRKPERCTNLCCFLMGNNKCTGRGGLPREHSEEQKKMAEMWFGKPNIQTMSGGLWNLKKILWVQDNLRSKPKYSKNYKIFFNSLLCIVTRQTIMTTIFNSN